MILQSERIKLRRFKASDLDDAFLFLSHPEVMRYSLSGPYSRQQTVDGSPSFLLWCQTQYEKKGQVCSQWFTVRMTGSLDTAAIISRKSTPRRKSKLVIDCTLTTGAKATRLKRPRWFETMGLRISTFRDSFPSSSPKISHLFASPKKSVCRIGNPIFSKEKFWWEFTACSGLNPVKLETGFIGTCRALHKGALIKLCILLSSLGRKIFLLDLSI